MSKLKELLEKRAQAHTEMVEVLKKDQTAETRAKVAEINTAISTLETDIANIRRADAIAKEIATTTVDDNTSGELTKEQREKNAAEYRKAFFEHARYGQPGNKWQKGASERATQILLETRNQMQRAQTPEQRDQVAGTQSITYTEGTVGGYFVPAGFVYDVEKATKYFCPILDGSVVRILETATGAVLPYPTSNDTQQAWKVVGEATQVTEQGTNTNYPTQGVAPSGDPGNVLLGHVNFGAWKGTTGLIRVSLELLQDSAFNLEAFLNEAFAVRLGRGYEYYLTSGTGVNQPTGILTAIAASGAVPVTATGSSLNDGVAGNTGVNSIGYADIVGLIHSIDPTYRRGAKFMLHDSTLAHLKTRLDQFGRPLWVPSTRESEPDRIAGYEYVINQSFPAIGASKTTLAFGQWSKFIVRKVKDLQVLRLDERFADYGEVAYVAFSRIDSNLVDAGTHPINVLQQAS